MLDVSNVLSEEFLAGVISVQRMQVPVELVMQKKLFDITVL